MIWNKTTDIAAINKLCAQTIHEPLGIQIKALNSDSIVGTMPIHANTKQPHGILHGGASIVLAESLGSIATMLVLDDEHIGVGQSVMANHIRPGIDGHVTGVCKPIHLGKKSHIWEINLSNDDNKLVCTVTLTMAILSKPNTP